MPAESSLQSRILKSFDRYRDPAAGPLTKAFGKRLVGELIGESRYVAAALDTSFEVVMHVGGATMTLPGSAIVEGAPGQATAGVLMWTEFDDFVVDGDTIAARGIMGATQTTDVSTQQMPSVDALRAALAPS